MNTELPGTDLALDDIRLGDIEQWMRPDREGIFAKLRAERPVSFHEEPAPPTVSVRRVRATGQIALTRTPKRSSSRAITIVIDAMPALAAA